jgi:hypothetical protein
MRSSSAADALLYGDERVVGRLERGHGLSSLGRKDEGNLAVEGLQRAGEMPLVGGEGRTGLARAATAADSVFGMLSAERPTLNGSRMEVEQDGPHYTRKVDPRVFEFNEARQRLK